MKSGKLRAKEIKARRLRFRLALGSDAPLARQAALRPGAVIADRDKLAHNNTYGLLPLFYLDRAFTCRDCGAHEVWTAKQQKRWYEDAQGNINSVAVRCKTCRQQEQKRKEAARLSYFEGMARKRASRLCVEQAR